MKRILAFLMIAVLPLSLAETASADAYAEWSNILLIGADEESGDPEGTQTLVILSVNAGEKIVRLTSVIQDIAVDTKAYGERPLRELFALGGADALLGAMNALLDASIIRYILIDMTPLADIVDSLGGVQIDPDDALFEALASALDEAGVSCPPDDGKNLYGGEQALLYSRLRKNGDAYSVNQSQRDVIVAASSKVLNSGVFACLRIVPKLFDMLTMNIPFGELIGTIYGLAGMDAAEIPEMWVPKIVNSMERTEDGWLLRADPAECRALFHSYIYGDSSRYAEK